MNKEQLKSNILLKKSFLCIGLDPNLELSNNNTNFKLTQTQNNEFIVLCSPNGEIVDYVQLDRHQLNHSVGRDLNNGSWSIFTNSTPGSSNVSATAYDGYVSSPEFDYDPGFYNSAINLSIG